MTRKWTISFEEALKKLSIRKKGLWLRFGLTGGEEEHEKVADMLGTTSHISDWKKNN